MNADGTEQRAAAPDIEFARDPNWAPDGRYIVLQDSSAIAVVDSAAPSGSPHKLTDGMTNDENPDWAPDGSWIAFVRTAANLPNRDLYVIRPDGSDLRQLTTSGNVEQVLGWLTDGRVAFDTLGTTPATLAVDVAGGTPTAYTVELSDPYLSPDGSWKLFERGDDIFRMHPDGTAINDLTNAVGMDTGPRWAPDGTRIVFLSDRDDQLGAVDYLGQPLPVQLRVADAMQAGRMGPSCVTTRSATETSVVGVDAPGVGFAPEPLSVPAGAPLTFLPFLNDADALTITAYRYDVALAIGSLQHNQLLRPCAPPGGAEDACLAGTAHAFTADLGLTPGHYIVVVSLTWQREHEQGSSEQGFNIVVTP
jgi:Tol biopolymer transport system component